jgi:hypothetical protein
MRCCRVPDVGPGLQPKRVEAHALPARAKSKSTFSPRGSPAGVRTPGPGGNPRRRAVMQPSEEEDWRAATLRELCSGSDSPSSSSSFSPGSCGLGRPPDRSRSASESWESIFGRRQRDDDKPIPARSRASSSPLARTCPCAGTLRGEANRLLVCKSARRISSGRGLLEVSGASAGVLAGHPPDSRCPASGRIERADRR